MRRGRNLWRCVLSAMSVGALSVPGLAEPSTHPATQPAEFEATSEAPQAAAPPRVETLFWQNERQIRQAINDHQFQVARDRVEIARRTLESARGEMQPHERYRELTRQLDSLSRFIESEERMGIARPPRGVLRAAATLEHGEPARLVAVATPLAGGHRADDGPAHREELARREGPNRLNGDRRTHGRLGQESSMIHFPEGTSFEDFLNWLRQRSGLSIDVNWRALAVLGIDRTTDTLGLTLKSARFETVLRLVLDNISPPETPIDYDIVDGVVRISTREQLDRYRITRVYDVSDLLIRTPSFRSEDSGFGMGGGMGMGTGMGGMGTMGGTGTGLMGFPGGFQVQGQQPGLSR